MVIIDKYDIEVVFDRFIIWRNLLGRSWNYACTTATQWTGHE